MILKEIIGIQIKKYRKINKMTQEKLSEMVGIDSRHLSRLENGKNYPGLVTLEKISDALNIQIKVLFDSQEGEAIDKIHGMIAIASSEQLRIISKMIRAVVEINL